MGLGILESRTASKVPGTVTLDEAAAHSENVTGNLKHGHGKDHHIVLVPQPSDDPNDPLNWSSFQKHVVLVIICFGTIVNGAIPGPLLNAGFVQMSMELGVSVDDLVKTSGYVLLTTGAIGIFASAAARKYGKRPVYVLSSIFAFIGVIIGETASGYDALVASRVIHGFGVAAYESIVVSTIGDLFFVHERGLRVASVIFLLAAISNGTSIIAGVITNHLGWHYNFHILIPFVALQLVLCVLFAPETTYRRDRKYNVDTAGRAAPSEGSSLSNEKDPRAEKVEKVPSTTAEDLHLPPLPKKTFWQSLALYNGTFVDDSIFKMVIACPAILCNVGASYTIFVSGVTIAWYVAVALLSSIIFSAPPYLFAADSIGYTSVGPLIGGFLSSVMMAIISDPFAKWMARKNNGVFEPEFRIPLILVGAICSVAGLVGFGHTVAEGRSVYLACFVWGTMLFGLTNVATTTTAYALDAYRDYSTEIFIMNMVFKNFFFYGVTEYIVDWYTTDGVAKIFDVMGGISAALCFLSLPIYIFGKKYRHFWDKYNVIKMLHLETDKTGADGG
ncbi:major facilitator superfamily domain-containing protein [Lineolata rhizophorae]|uniref:Major facilitator superfamily domain-containing protein n=1 Tax=Lineolata rhizophorae TaxID=578093 RepID=A0A6A6PFI0_9PEZI|nr:major facilitator superfamily domain-containing protein [Lineolata rhizophorae]